MRNKKLICKSISSFENFFFFEEIRRNCWHEIWRENIVFSLIAVKFFAVFFPKVQSSTFFK